MKNSSLPILILITCFLFHCSPEASESTSSKVEEQESSVVANKTASIPDEAPKENLKVIVSSSKDNLIKYYDLPHLKEIYWDGYKEPRPLEYPEDISSLSYEDLRLLRNEVFARNGYLFTDGYLRGYFNQFDWYQPIFDVDSFTLVMFQEEQDLVNRLLEEETKRKQALYIDKDNLKLLNGELIANKKQFKYVPQPVLDDLYKNNFSIINANRSMPFYTYDENAYQFIPHYITTDLYLFILHKYFSRFIEKLDEKYMSQQLWTILDKTDQKLNEKLQSVTDPQLRDAYEWAQAYVVLAKLAGGRVSNNIPGRYAAVIQQERNSIDSKGTAEFIKNPFVLYAELKPRAHYTKSDNLKNYFKAFKWISLNGIDTRDKTAMEGIMALANTIKENPEIYSAYTSFTETMEKLAGVEDNISFKDVINALPEGQLDLSSSDQVAKDLNSLNKEKIKLVLGEEFKTPEREANRIYFISSTYSVSGEIFSKLVHVNRGKSKRPYPSALDVPAVFGNRTAQNILLNEFNEDEKWEKYVPQLNQLQDQFKDFNGWDHNYGVRGLKTALASTAEADQYPDFMKTDAYNRKELSTMLSSWTHIKHDLVLYQEKPHAAESGQGGGPEPPVHYSYVEPNLEFWNEALELVEWLEDLNMIKPEFDSDLTSIRNIGAKLRSAVQKQLKGEELTKKEHKELHFIGGQIEYIFLRLLETDHIPDREKSMALIADVYFYDGKNLNVAVGHGDDIHVLVPINGEICIARGSTFSFYEFKGEIYNDEEWREKVEARNVPERPEWIKHFINNERPLEGQMKYRFVGYGLDGQW